MRILAIRGCNLASLYGRFELPLDQGPIAASGLFSISGPTGAGKSTLVDALCLALFNATPRLQPGGRNVLVGRADEDEALRVDASDTRNLLSRGAGEAWAEVDFEGVDGLRYRAEWRVNRARGRPDGRLQAVRMVLSRLDGMASPQAIADGRGSVPAEVARRLGYSFQEFTRAVVLPQFEFTAFLAARPDERAAILERVTGTDLYTRLSRAAHQRAAAEGERLRTLRDRAGQLHVLPPDERTAAEGRAEALAGESDAAAEAVRRAEEAVQWHAQARALAADVDQSERALAAARAEREAGAALRAELAAVESAQDLRPVHDRARDVEARRAALAARSGRAAQRFEAAEEAARAAAAAEAGAAEAATESAARLEAARPVLERARALDVRVAEAERSEEAARAAHRRERELAEAARRAAADAERGRVEAAASRDAAARWLEAHRGEAPLADEWRRWRALLADHAGLVRDLGLAGAALTAASGARATSAKAHLERTSALREAEAAHGALEERARRAEEARRGDDPRALHDRVAALGDRRHLLQQLRTCAAEAERSGRERDAAAREAAGARAEAEAARALARAEEAALAAARAAFAEARAALARIEAVVALEDRRPELVAGEPCPLCGATEHPYARSAPGASLRQAQAAAVDAAEREVTARGTALHAAEDRAGRAGERGDGQERLAARHADALAAASLQYASLAASAAWQGVPAGAAEAGPALAALAEELAEALQAAQRAQSSALERQAVAERAARGLESSRSELERLRRAAEQAGRDAEASAADERRLTAEVEGLAVRRDGLEAQLAAVLGFRDGWVAEARRDPAGLARALGGVADAYLGQVAARDEAVRRLDRLQAEASHRAREAEESARRHGEAEERARQEAERVAAARAERSALLDGRPADAVERALRDADARARLALEEARRAAREAGETLAAATEERNAAAAELAAAEREAGEASRALAEALRRHGLDGEVLVRLLGRDTAWREGARTALAALERRVAEEERSVAERRQRLGALEAGRPPLGPDEAARHAAAAADEARRARTALEEQRVALREDDRAREALRSVTTELEAQDAVAQRWARLSDVIGSADGKKLRVFAQGLTLDLLLAQANLHLVQLAPRYVLMRVPGTDLELQVVDRDLADEVRTVNGLSGGESFLVSLALALGLASLASRATHARTLFIDEGFGTLDRDTLEKAMFALQRLQASGRTIGVISHLAELHERIGVRVAVERVGVGRSRVVLPETATPPAVADEALRAAS